jgi:tryptophan halogenase
MPDRDRAVKRVVVAGGGITGWSAAAALKRRLPLLDVTIVPVPVPPAALADRFVGTLPSITEFHADLGLGDADTIVRAQSGLRLGTQFEGWAEGRPSYVHAYGEYGRSFGAIAFHQHWIRSVQAGGDAAYDSQSAAAAAARANRFVPTDHNPNSPLSGIGHGLQLNLRVYHEMMKAYALHLGVRQHAGELRDVPLRADDGFIASLQLADGSAVEGDLYIDCTGPEARLRSVLDQRFEEWQAWLPCDRRLLGAGPAPADPPTCVRAIAAPAGWLWQTVTPIGTSFGAVYAADFATDETAAGWLRSTGAASIGTAIPLRQGRRSQPWLRNCVAVGDAAVAVEPLEWTNLHLAHNAIDRIIAMMPDKDFAAVELWDYNRQAAAEADRVRDFLALHYLTASRPADPFWRKAAAVEPPASLAHTLRLFRERGRLPYYEEETFSRDSWLAILFGNGIIPQRTDPLIDTIPMARSEQAMARMRDTIEAILPKLPTQAAYLRSIARQDAR